METHAKLFIVAVLFLCSLQMGGITAKACLLSNIKIKQSRTGYLIEGQPEYRVTVKNNCHCPQSNVLLRCTGFSSVENIDPNLFRQLGDGLCSVNNGAPISPGAAVVFRFAWLTPFDLNPASSTGAC